MKPATTDMEKSDFRVRYSASQSRVWGPSIMSSAISRFLFFSGVCSIALVALLYAAVVDRLTPWQDELFVVSAGLSIARSQPPIESVIALYPQSDSPIKFYGPVSFEAAARLIRIFGPSMGPWRLACFGGVIFNLLIAVRLVRLGGGNEWAQLADRDGPRSFGIRRRHATGPMGFRYHRAVSERLLLLLIGIGAQGSGLLLAGRTCGSTHRCGACLYPKSADPYLGGGCNGVASGSGVSYDPKKTSVRRVWHSHPRGPDTEPSPLPLGAKLALLVQVCPELHEAGSPQRNARHRHRWLGSGPPKP